MHDDPYAPPRAPIGADPHAGMDSADLFIESVAPPILRAAAFAWLGIGAIACLFLLRLLLGVEPNLTAGLLEAGQLVLAIVAFSVGVGVLRGYPVLAIVGFGLAPLALAASLFALLTGSVAGLLGMGVTILAVVLTLASWKALAKVSAARVALARIRRGDEAATPSTG
jgi:hypothetical protein